MFEHQPHINLTGHWPLATGHWPLATGAAVRM